MTLRLNGSTSGYVEIDAPATAGSNTLVLPNGNGSANQLLKNGTTAGSLGWSSMVETATGVGIGLASPGQALDVKGVVRSSIGTGTGAGGAAYAFYQFGTSATATENWHIGAEGDGTFRFYNQGFGSGIERMRISNAGGVFVNGTTSPVSGNPSDGIHTGSGGGHFGDTSLTLGDGIASARWRLITGGYHLNFYQNNGSGTYVSRAYVTNSTGAYVAVSDNRAKKDIADAGYGIDTLKQLRPVSYLMKDQDEATARRNLGFIAQEVLNVVPEAVNVPADPEQMYGLESSALIPVLVSSLQQAVAKIESLEARIAALEATP